MSNLDLSQETAAQDSALSTVSEPVASESANWPSRTTVLLVDADVEAGKTLAKTLREINPRLEVVHADTGREALDYTEAHPVDCVILEYALPDYDGLCLIDMLRSADDLSIVPSIIITDHGSEALAVDAIHAGASDYFRKAHLAPEMLAKSVTHAVERNRLTRALSMQKHQLGQQLLDFERRNEIHRLQREEMAHRLLTPLSSVQEFVSLVLDGIAGPISDQQGKYLAYARGACQSLRHSIEAMVVSTQIGSATSNYQYCDLDRLVDETLGDFELDAQSKGVQIASTIDGEIPEVRVDAQEFKQVLRQLIQHALNASNEASYILVMLEVDPSLAHNVRVSVTAHPSLSEQMNRSYLSATERKAGREMFSKGNYLIETRFDSELQFSFSVPTNSNPDEEG